MENHTAKHFALQLGSLVSLYLSLSFLLVLLFGLINLLYPDAANGYYETVSANSSVRIGIAMVLVFFPTYLTLTRIVNNNRRDSKDSKYLGLTKWLIYLSLLIGGGALLGDLVAVIMIFLEGEITTRFVLKALAVLLVVGAAFNYYILDAKEYWKNREKQSLIFAGITTLFVVLSVGFGFSHIETPTAAREKKLDQTQISDLQQIQWQIQDYVSINDELPESIEQVYETNANKVPTAPEARTAYRYEVTDKGFSLCADFAQPSTGDEYLYGPSRIDMANEKQILNPDNWSHGAGEVCFERVISTSQEKSNN
ncbi:hypothetical protein H6784_00720 [Candidatus Nomurabacteria bacterium]|nr:hypothetical protein [Candidatus Nomurabacteria bacterium]